MGTPDAWAGCYDVGMGNVQRKHPNGRYTAEFRDQAARWVAAYPGRTMADGASRWEVSHDSIKRWMAEAGVKPLPETFSREAPGGAPTSRDAKPRKTPGGRYRAPVDEMSQPDRDRVVRTARSIAEVVELGSAAMLADLKTTLAARRKALRDGKPMPSVSIGRESAQGMLHLYRTLNLAVDTHPGLMKVAGIEEKTAAGERSLGEVMSALGITPAEAK